MWTLKAFQSYAQHRSDVEGVDNRNLDEWRAINQGEFHNFQCNIFPSLGYTNTHIHSTTTACDNISTGLVECEHVKAKIAQMAHPACGRSFLPRAEKGFPLLKISVGLLFVPQSGIGVHIGGRKPREIANKNISAFNLCFSNLFVVMR